MENLRKLLLDLGQDAQLASEYEKAPDDVIARYKIDAEAAKALRSINLEKLRELSGLETLRTTHSSVQAYE
ncbi:MAG: hypothetical protein LC637_09870 [Xanthomonadaceae bacterium]|nr:hypothetical protein [Xanthomonadaceae bacterium]